MPNPLHHRHVLVICFGYLLAGMLWVIFSDRLIGELPAAGLWQTGKGLVFVLASALGLYLLLSRTFELHTQREMLAREERERVMADNEAQYRLLFHANPVPMWILDEITKRFLAVNTAAENLYGWSREEFLRMTVFDVRPPESHDALHAAFERSLDRLSNFGVWQHRTKNGQELAVELLSQPMLYHGQPARLVMAHDVSERLRQEARLRLSATAFENSHEAILITDRAGRIQTCNSAFSRITGYALAEIEGQNPRILASGRHDPGFYRDLWSKLRAQGFWQGEIWNRKKNGELFAEWQTIVAVHDSDGATQHYLSIFSDITERKQNEERIRFLAHYDPLTELPNRRLLMERLGRALSRARHEHHRVAVMFIDLDRFKEVNDSLGHAVGDRLLCTMAQRITSSVRGSDTVARLGGDEFVVMLTDLEPGEKAVVVAQKLLDTLATPVNLDGRDFQLSASIGISFYPDDGDDADALLRNADAAMYRAKGEGRNAFRIYTRELTEKALAALSLEQELRRALDLGELELHYQGQFDLDTGLLVGAEALVRWRHPQRGLILPGQFIAIAEERGLIAALGARTLELACRQLRAWLDAGLTPVPVSVNLSALQLRETGLVEKIRACLERYAIASRWLQLELTESAVMHDLATSTAILRELTELGLRLAIDDFGTGYSSLAYLRRLPLHCLKIDRSFIAELNESADAAAITKTVITMARSLQLTALAEGVETPEQRRTLHQMGCTQVQGYLLARPETAGTFARRLRTESAVTPGHDRLYRE